MRGYSSRRHMEIGEAVDRALRTMKPPVADISHYGLYKWRLLDHQVLSVRYLNHRLWEITSEARYEGHHKGMSVGLDVCSLTWRYDENSGQVDLLDKQLKPPPGAPAKWSRPKIISAVSLHLHDMYASQAKLNWHDTAHFKLTYLGDGHWEVRVVITNAVGLWDFYEDNGQVRFRGLLGPSEQSGQASTASTTDAGN